MEFTAGLMPLDTALTQMLDSYFAAAAPTETLPLLQCLFARDSAQ